MNKTEFNQMLLNNIYESHNQLDREETEKQEACWTNRHLSLLGNIYSLTYAGYMSLNSIYKFQLKK